MAVLPIPFRELPTRLSVPATSEPTSRVYPTLSTPNSPTGSIELGKDGLSVRAQVVEGSLVSNGSRTLKVPLAAMVDVRDTSLTKGLGNG